MLCVDMLLPPSLCLPNTNHDLGCCCQGAPRWLNHFDIAEQLSGVMWLGARKRKTVFVVVEVWSHAD